MIIRCLRPKKVKLGNAVRFPVEWEIEKIYGYHVQKYDVCVCVCVCVPLPPLWIWIYVTFSSHECFPFFSWWLGVGLCFSLSYRNPWNAQICYSLQSFEALNQRAVAVVVDPIQSVKGKVVIDAFRLINPQTMMLGQEPRQTTSNLGHLNKPSIQVSASQIVV